ncbi:MAG: GDP-mannose 4,6-dehydratase, partial [Casimicrobium sp.]
ETLLGDPAHAKNKLGWTPTTTFAEMVKEMVQSDLVSAKRDVMLKSAGYAVGRPS